MRNLLGAAGQQKRRHEFVRVNATAGTALADGKVVDFYELLNVSVHACCIVYWSWNIYIDIQASNYPVINQALGTWPGLQGLPVHAGLKCFCRHHCLRPLLGHDRQQAIFMHRSMMMRLQKISKRPTDIWPSSATQIREATSGMTCVCSSMRSDT